VVKAAAVPVPDERLGERVCLIVQTPPGREIDAQQLLAHLGRAGLSKYDMPEYLATVDELPLMPSGKVFKRRLIEWMDEGRVAPAPVRYTSA
jgi:acyl-CoA synthetase